MKKTIKLFGLFAVAAMTVIGCAKEVDAPEEATNETPTEQSTFTHTVTITAGAPTTKTVINEGETSASFKWSSDDATRFHVWENDAEGTSVALETEDDYATMKLTATFDTEADDSYTYTAYLANNVFDDGYYEYPQVPFEQTCSSSSYDPNADILVAKPVISNGAVLNKIEMQFGRPCVINKMTLKGLTAGETLSSVEIRSDKPLTGYYDADGQSWTGQSSKIVLTTSQTVSAAGEATVYFVTMPVASATLTVTAITNAHVYDKTFTKTINFVLNRITVFGVNNFTKYAQRDLLTLGLTGVSGTSYSNFSAKSYAGAGHSSAVYAGTIAGGNSAIQLNTNKDKSYRGIVTTSSGGAVKKVRVSWESHTTTDRTVQLYGKNEAYSISDLNSSFGTDIGSIAKTSTGTDIEKTISSYYEFLMIKATGGALYLDEIEVFWDAAKSNASIQWTTDGQAGDTVEAADANINTGDDTMPAAALYNPNNIDLSEITFSSSKPEFATIGEHTGVITLVGEGDTEISATFAGNALYKPATVKYTLSVTDNRSTCATPTFSVPAGPVDENATVRISSDTPNSTIYYKIGSNPTTSSYDGVSTLKDDSNKPYIDITIDEAKTVKAIAVQEDWITSAVATASYTISGVGTPLSVPSNVKITVLNETTFTGTWSNDTNATDYEWIVSTSSTYAGIVHSGASKNVIIEGSRSSSEYTLSNGTCTITKTGLNLSGEYYFYVKAKGDGSTYLDSEGAGSAGMGLIVLVPDQNTTGSTSTSYVTTAKTFTTADGVGYSINNWNPNTSQLKGNKDNMLVFYNTSALPGSIRRIDIVRSSGTGTLSNSNCKISLATSAISSTPSSGTSASAGADSSTVYWTNTGNNTYFYLWFVKGATSGSYYGYFTIMYAL